MLLNFDFANNTILLCFSFFFSIIDFLILAAIAKKINSTRELVISIGIPSKEAKAQIEIHTADLVTFTKKICNRELHFFVQ